MASLHLAPSKHTYRLFVFYQVQTHAKDLEYASSTSTNIFDNGSYSVNHFSSQGAEMNFWEEHMLTDEVVDMLKEVGNYGTFPQTRGYSNFH